MSIAKKLMTAGATEDVYVDEVFSTYLYEGNGTTQTITNGIDLAGEGGLVWAKSRTLSRNHHLVDTERGPSTGAAPGKTIYSNASDAESVNNDTTAFYENGYQVGSADNVNKVGETFVSWTFRKAPKFFDIVTYTGNNSAPTTVPHGLGVKPGMIIIKSIDSVSNWFVWHKDFALSSATGHYHQWCALNLTEAQGTVRGAGLTGEPTAESFTVSNGSGVVGAEQDYVAYVFAHDDSDESIIKCGSYAGTGGVGQEIDLGWEPQFILIKNASRGGQYWVIQDSMRGINDKSSHWLHPNNSDAEAVAGDSYLTLTSTGFRTIKPNAATDYESDQYIYMAIRRPNKPAEEFEPEELFAMFRSNNPGNLGGLPGFRSGFPVDMGLWTTPDGGGTQKFIGDRHNSGSHLYTHSADPAYTSGSIPDNFKFDYSNGYYSDGNASYFSWMWRRAPGFFDVVTYDGDGQEGRELVHSLGVAPEMMWIKRRNESYNWIAWADSLEANEHLYLNDLAGKDNNFDFLSNTRPTESVITLSSDFGVNSSGNTYIAYLFASVPGISKVGSYTGTGSTVLEIDCGFTSGARFVLIKRTDAAGDWSVFDTERGISVTQDPRLALNTIDAQETGFSYVNPTASGFSVVPLGANSQNLNQGGAEYIYYAIA